jgi:soluble lytic murein transglycosylase-like protein
VLLSRRSTTWPVQLKCRNKGKAVIVRLGNINTGGSLGMGAGPIALWSRRLVSILALGASMAALALIVESQYGQLVFGESAQQPHAAQSADTAPARGEVVVLAPAEESRYRALAEYVAKRYRVSQEVAFDLVAVAHKAGREFQLDPLLIIAVISVESSFNPIAESVAGAKGLMQIIPKYHGEKLSEFGGPEAVFDPAANIQVGAKILREYIRITGNLGSALQMYNGALSDTEDQYTNKVLSVKQRLQQVVSQPVRPAAPVTPLRTAALRSSSSSALQFD